MIGLWQLLSPCLLSAGLWLYTLTLWANTLGVTTMTKEDIIEIANNMNFMDSIWIQDDSKELKDLIAFAELVAQHEREECAKIAEKEWVGLTDEEIQELHYQVKVKGMGVYRTEDIYRAVEAALKEKNT